MGRVETAALDTGCSESLLDLGPRGRELAAQVPSGHVDLMDHHFDLG